MSLSDPPVLPVVTPDHSGRSRSRRVAVWSLLLPAATGVAILVVMTAASSMPATLADLTWSVGFLVWNLLPLGAMAVLLVWSSRRGWADVAVVELGSVAVAVIAGLALVDFSTSDSSTAALLFIFLPMYLWVAVAVSAMLALAVRRWITKHPSGSQSPAG